MLQGVAFFFPLGKPQTHFIFLKLWQIDFHGVFKGKEASQKMYALFTMAVMFVGHPLCQSGFSGVTEPIGYAEIYIEREYEGLAHMTIEAEKSHNLLSANWRPRKADGRVLIQTQRFRNQGSQGYKSQSESKTPRTRSTSVLGQKRQVFQQKQ